MFKKLFTAERLEKWISSNIKKFLMKNSKRIAKFFLDYDKKYGQKIPVDVETVKVFNGTLVSGYTTAIVKISKEKDEIVGIFEDDDDMDDGFRAYSKIEELSGNIPVYYFTLRKRIRNEF